MKAHWQYLRYVLIHKWYVFTYCCVYGIPFAGIVHDLSKFHPREWFPYVEYFYGGPHPEKWFGDARNVFDDKYTKAWVEARFDEAWNYHQKANPHHWQFWVLMEDSGAVKCLEMPERYRREMLADWRGAGKAINGKDDTRNWYIKNYAKIQLHPKTRAWVDEELGVTQRDIGGDE